MEFAHVGASIILILAAQFERHLDVVDLCRFAERLKKSSCELIPRRCFSEADIDDAADCSVFRIEKRAGDADSVF